jgi:hypothetical protein
MNKYLLIVFLFSLVCLKSFALDYGLVLNQVPVAHNEENEDDGLFDYTGIIRPWISGPLGDNGGFYFSGGLTALYEKEEWAFLPDVSRFEIEYRPLPNLSLVAGRFSFSDPLGCVCSGLFDGLGAVWDIRGTRFRLGAFYTGLLYKKTDHILMTSSDISAFHDRDEYFASRRLVFALNWEAPSFLDSRSNFDFGLLAQIDLNDSQRPDTTTLHSQYVLARWTRSLGRGWYAEAGLTASHETAEGKSGFGFAFSLSPFWVPPSRPADRLFFNFRVSSGNWNDTVRAFKPITTEAQGEVLRTGLSGISWAQTGYAMRIHPNIQGEISAAWFFRTDRETFVDTDLNGNSDSYSLGGEIAAGLNWVPESWVGLNLGGGVFIPQLNGAYNSGAVKWRVAAGLLLSL